MRQLEEVIRQHGDSYARERAVFDLAQLQQEASVPFLKELAMRDPDVNVRAAAFANIRLLKKELPEPAKGDLRVQTSGPVLVGGRVTIDVTFASQVDVTRARLLLHVPPGIELVGGERGWTGRLTANQPQQVKAEMEIQRDGTLVVPVALKLDWDQVDYELIQKSIVLDTSSGRVVVREQGHDAGGR